MAEALAAVMEELFVLEASEGGIGCVLRRALPIGDGLVRFEARDPSVFHGSTSAGPADALVTARLRATAEAIRVGDAPCVIPRWEESEPDFEPDPEEQHVLFLKPVRYIGRHGAPVLHTAWSTRVPRIVAQAAKDRKLALDADTEQARREMAAMSARRRVTQALDPRVRLEDAVNLGVNVRSWAEGERERRREEWLKNHGSGAVSTIAVNA